MRTRSYEFAEWIDLDENDFSAIGRFPRRAGRGLVLLGLCVAIGAVMLFAPSVLQHWLFVR